MFEPEDHPTWLTAFETSQELLNLPVGPYDKYVAALYFSLMTITSIGYGAMLPENTFERLVCTLMMLFSSMLWCYVIGTASGIAATLDPDGLRFHENLDHLNLFMSERRCAPRPLCTPLRRSVPSCVHQRGIHARPAGGTHLMPLGPSPRLRHCARDVSHCELLPLRQIAARVTDSVAGILPQCARRAPGGE
jgi:hypothetical protein